MTSEKSLMLFALAALLVWGTAADDDPIRIGVVDVEQAFNSTDEGKAAREELARKQREAQAAIQPLVDEIQAKEEDLQAKRFVLSDEALFQKQLDLKELQNQIENKVKQLQGQLQLDQTRIQGPLEKKLRDIISEAGKSAGFTVIFARDAPGLLYTREALDITDLVVEKYNQKS
ncbi:MAG: OmpH family outer membrane protein [Myxococcota bacterium]